MLLTSSDFTGNWRLPSGATPDLQAAIDQAERRLLEVFFERKTADFILAAPTQPPATTLLAGGTVVRSFRDLIPAMAGLITLSVVGIGAQTAAVKGQTESHRWRAWLEGRTDIYRYQRELIAESEYWRWTANVLSVSGAVATISIPATAVSWVRVGTPVGTTAWGAGDVVAITANTIDVQYSSPLPLPAPSTTRAQLLYKLKDRLWSM